MRLWICRLKLLTDSSQPHNSTMRQARISRATSTQWRMEVAFINESSPSTHRPRISLGNVAIDFSWMGKRDWKTDTCQFWPPTRDVTCVACCLSGWPTFGLRKARLFFRPLSCFLEIERDWRSFVLVFRGGWAWLMWWFLQRAFKENWPTEGGRGYRQIKFMYLMGNRFTRIVCWYADRGVKITFGAIKIQ